MIAKDLGAGLIVEGSSTVTGNGVRVDVRLVNALDDHGLASLTCERPLDNLVDLYREIAGTLALSIADRLRNSQTRTSKAPSTHPEAELAYLRGRFHWYKMSPLHFGTALDYFEQAITIDPHFAAAHAATADVLGAFAYWGIRPPGELRESVRQSIERAESADPNSAEARMLRGAFCFYYERDWLSAEENLRAAIGLNPNLAHARLLFGLFLGTHMRPQAIDEFDIATRIDPLNPAMQFGRALWLGANGDHDAAISTIERALEVDPTHGPVLQLLADLFWLTDDPRALETERRAWAADEEIAAVLGNEPVASAGPLRDALEALLTRASLGYVQSRQIARLLVHCGEHDAALDCLEHAASSGDLMQIDFLQLSPAFDPLRNTSRFRELQTALSLP